MADLTERTIALSQLDERLRQEREAFNQKKEKDMRSFRLRMTMGWIACIMLPAITVTCFLVLYFHDRFTSATVTTAGGTLLVEVLGCFVAIWRVFAGDKPEVLEPVTPMNPPRSR